VVNTLVVSGPQPTLRADDEVVPLEAGEAREEWAAVVTRLLQLWV
jgi:hypothetical protein